MDTGKIKNIIILALVLADLFLLGVVGADRIEAAAGRRESLQAAEAVLADRGIELLDDSGFRTADAEVRTVSRDLKTELRRVSAVLGETQAVDQGGSIYYYRGEYGEATFRGTGDFSFLMQEGAVPEGKNAEKTAEQFLKKLGLSAGGAQTDSDGASGTLTFVCRVDGTDVLNCTVTFRFVSGSLNVVTGTRPLDGAETDDTRQALSVPTILTRFLAVVDEAGLVCSRITDAKLCWVQQITSVSGAGELRPVWCIGTDAGTIYVDGLTGERESLA